jgi:glycine dehydrogenase
VQERVKKQSPAEELPNEPLGAEQRQSEDRFVRRHIGPRPHQRQEMLETLGYSTLDALIADVVPPAIRLDGDLRLPAAATEFETLARLRTIASQNKVFRSYIGMGYSDCITPPVIQRNILENPGWYTQYTPYQAEISQGRLEALLNFQTMISDLTALPISNASLLDEATAAGEAMALCKAVKPGRNVFLVSAECHPQTLHVVRTRAAALGIEVVKVRNLAFEFDDHVCGVLVQYPDTFGIIADLAALAEQAHAAGALVVAAADLLALTLLKPPGEFGADVAVGSAQRFGVPLGYGGPHAAYMACRDAFKRQIPGRIIGVSRDAAGRPALRLALQTREQHIRREKATSNICTAQALLANMASMYACYHGPEGLRGIASRVHRLTSLLAAGLRRLRFELPQSGFFDTLTITVPEQQKTDEIHQTAERHGMNFRRIDDSRIGVSLDETSSERDVHDILVACNAGQELPFEMTELDDNSSYSAGLARTSAFLTHPVFNTYHSETELMRYIKRLESRDLSLTTSMIPLGSCTMKLNAAAEMLPITWPEFSRIHPFAPAEQAKGYHQLFGMLEDWLAEITGFAAVSLQPNSGAQGEYAGLLVIRAWHMQRGEAGRNVCLIPVSAHGTNPASAVMAGFQVVGVACDKDGNIDLKDLKSKAEAHKTTLGALMVTYPSTHGVFEEHIKDVCEIVHAHGGQVYMDGANMNAQVGLCRPGDIGADVCHLNLHKTFCIPHGGGGPGMGPICVAEHLSELLPGHPTSGSPSTGAGAVSSAPWGSANILPISWVYIAMMGPDGLAEATKQAILSANYIARRVQNHFPVLYKGRNGLVAHECILDLRGFKSVTVEDVAKRLMDFGFHAPTISWPVAGTMMVEPTESEPREELDRFCEALFAIHKEIQAIESGQIDARDNPLKNAPHTAESIAVEVWSHPYTREQACFPAAWLRQQKFWPPVARVDNVHGDRNLVCTCVGMEAYS